MILHVMNYNNIDVDYMVGAQLKGFDVMVKLTEENPLHTLNLNIKGTQNILESCKQNNVKKIISYGQASKKIAIALRDAVELDQVSSLRDAVEVCHKSAVPGDIVLLSPGCASFDQFNNYEERGNEFKKIVNEMAQA